MAEPDAPTRPHPLRNRVLVRQAPPAERAGEAGILFAPQGSEAWPNLATVLEVGPQDEPLDARPGDRVIFGRQPGSALVPDHRERVMCPAEWEGLLVLRSENIHLVVTREDEPGVHPEPPTQAEFSFGVHDVDDADEASISRQLGASDTDTCSSSQDDSWIGRDPGVLGGKPRIRDSRLSVEFVRELAASGGTPETIAGTYGIPREAVDAALRYEGDAGAAELWAPDLGSES